ncbi:MAG: isoleucyl-tRNA synthetase, partial [Acidimicrobiales bacterium]
MNTKLQEEHTSEKSDVAVREEVTLAFWKEHDIFNKTLAKESPNGDFVFYDGPPFATGLPHYGHILAGTIKDAVPRFWTMNGYHVPRKWGWDCHGLPVENLIEKKLGLAAKRDIEDYGIQNFNEAARDVVMEYADDWKKIIPRMGRWADMDNDYKTMDSAYTESVWWVFSQLHKKGLVYEGFKSMHLCPRCGTTLSNFEVNQGYKDIKDIAITVKLPLLDAEGKVTDTSLLVWTTTPWTMPGNMAAAVNSEFDYVKCEVVVEQEQEVDVDYSVGKRESVILAKEVLKKTSKKLNEEGTLFEFGAHTLLVVEEFKGSELVGKKYEPPFAYHSDREFEGKENAWQILHADYVEIGEEGTGAVHLAPAYGSDDMELAQEHSVPLVHHVDNTGHFMDFVTDFAGQLVKPKDDDEAGVMHLDADIEIVKALQANGKLFKKENITHSYPHCWRCDTPLLNYATTSWFVEVTKIKDRLVEENNKIKWVPEHVGRARFGKWLEGARDWAVSRQRYWGAPLPIWRNPETKDFKVMGSLADLQAFVPNTDNTFIITRHGESQFNTRGALNGINGVENSLTEKGITQSKEAALKLAAEGGVDVIYYSPLDRTKETAESIAQELGLEADALVSDERLTEMKFGPYEGKDVEEYIAFFGDGVGRLNKTPEGGESWSDVKRRVGAFMYDINKQHKEKRILIVSHNGTLQMIQAATAGDSFDATAGRIDDDSYDVANAELREMAFTPMPHNDNYELDFHRPYIDDVELFEGDVKL